MKKQQEEPSDLRDYEAALACGGFHADAPKHRRCAFGDVFAFVRDDDGWTAHVIYPPREWGPPHTQRVLLALNFDFEHGTLVAREHARIVVYEDGEPGDVAHVPLTLRGCQWLGRAG